MEGGGKNKRDNSIPCQQLSPGTEKVIHYYQERERDNGFGSFAPHTGSGVLGMLAEKEKRSKRILYYWQCFWKQRGTIDAHELEFSF